MKYLDMPGNEILKNIHEDLEKAKKQRITTTVAAIAFPIGFVVAYNVVMTQLVKNLKK